MTTLSQSLMYAAQSAEQRAAEAIADGDPKAAEISIRNAEHFRRLAATHRARVIVMGDASYDPQQDTTGTPGSIASADIVAIRSSLGMTQDALARALGTTQTTVSRWEANISPVANPTMLRLALESLVALHGLHDSHDRESS